MDSVIAEILEGVGIIIRAVLLILVLLITVFAHEPVCIAAGGNVDDGRLRVAIDPEWVNSPLGDSFAKAFSVHTNILLVAAAGAASANQRPPSTFNVSHGQEGDKTSDVEGLSMGRLLGADVVILFQMKRMGWAMWNSTAHVRVLASRAGLRFQNLEIPMSLFNSLSTGRPGVVVPPAAGGSMPGFVPSGMPPSMNNPRVMPSMFAGGMNAASQSMPSPEKWISGVADEIAQCAVRLTSPQPIVVVLPRFESNQSGSAERLAGNVLHGLLIERLLAEPDVFVVEDPAVITLIPASGTAEKTTNARRVNVAGVIEGVSSDSVPIVLRLSISREGAAGFEVDEKGSLKDPVSMADVVACRILESARGVAPAPGWKPGKDASLYAGRARSMVEIGNVADARARADIACYLAPDNLEYRQLRAMIALKKYRQIVGPQRGATRRKIPEEISREEACRRLDLFFDLLCAAQDFHPNPADEQATWPWDDVIRPETIMMEDLVPTAYTFWQQELNKETSSRLSLERVIRQYRVILRLWEPKDALSRISVRIRQAPLWDDKPMEIVSLFDQAWSNGNAAVSGSTVGQGYSAGAMARYIESLPSDSYGLDLRKVLEPELTARAKAGGSDFDGLFWNYLLVALNPDEKERQAKNQQFLDAFYQSRPVKPSAEQLSVYIQKLKLISSCVAHSYCEPLFARLGEYLWEQRDLVSTSASGLDDQLRFLCIHIPQNCIYRPKFLVYALKKSPVAELAVSAGYICSTIKQHGDADYCTEVYPILANVLLGATNAAPDDWAVRISSQIKKRHPGVDAGLSAESAAAIHKQVENLADKFVSPAVLQERKMLAGGDGRCLRIGLIDGELCHENTGLAEVSMLGFVLNTLVNESHYSVYDRMNTEPVLKEMALAMTEEQRKKVTRLPVDLVVRLRDYSRQDGNGVEAWVTKLTSRGDNYSPILNGSYRVGKVGAAESTAGIGKDVAKTLLERVEKLRGDINSSNDVSGVKPRNIIFDILRPVEQSRQVWQCKMISEGFVGEVSRLDTGLKILSRDDWSLVWRERLAMQDHNESPSAMASGDVLLGGRVWNSEKGIGFLFIADDLFSGRIIGTLSATGSVASVAKDLAKWCSDLRIPSETGLPSGIVRDKLLEAERVSGIMTLGLDYASLRRYANVTRKKNVPAGIVPGKDTIIRMARENWGNQQHNSAILLLEQEWGKQGDPDVGDCLAGYYHEMAMYSFEVRVLDKMLSGAGVNPAMVERLARAKSLARNSSEIAVADAAIKQRPDKPAELRYLHDHPDSKLASGVIRNQLFDELYYSARWVKASDVGQEWYPDGRIRVYETTLDFPDKTAEEVIRNGLACESGMWRKIFEENARSSHAEVALWQSQPLFEGKTLHGTARREYLTSSKCEMGAIFELAVHPDLIVGGTTAIEFLNNIVENGLAVTGGMFKVQLQEYVVADILASKGDQQATTLLRAAMSAPLHTSAYTGKGPHESVMLTVFRAYKGDETALSLLNDLKWVSSSVREIDLKDLLYLFSKAGRKNVVTTLLNHKDAFVSGNDELINSVRWANPELVRDLLVNDAAFMSKKFGEGNTYLRLVEGFGSSDVLEPLNKFCADGSSWDVKQALVLYYGLPIDEILNAKAPEKNRKEAVIKGISH